MSADTHPFTFIHPLCGLPAVHLASIPRMSDLIFGPSKFEHLDGRRARPADPLECESCRQPFRGVDLLAMTDPSRYRLRAGLGLVADIRTLPRSPFWNYTDPS